MTGPDDLPADALRQLVREVLRDVLPTLANRTSPPSGEDPHAPGRPDRDGLRDPAYPVHDARDARPGLAYPGHAGGPAAGPPSRPPTSVPRSDSAQTPSARNPMDMGFSGTQPAESHIHRVGAGQSRAVPGGGRLSADGRDGSLQEVALSTDADLHAFVLRILHLADNPKRRRDILAGRLRFTLAGGGHQAPTVTQRVDKGAVTERAVIAAARAGAGLVLGPRAVLTPLARDKARALGVPVEKER